MIPKTYLPWFIIVGIISFGLWTWYINDRAYNRGYDFKKKEYELAVFQAQEKFQFELAKQARGYDLASAKIRKASDNGCVGPANLILFDWLRGNHIGE